MDASFTSKPLLLALMLVCFAKRADSLVESTIGAVVNEKLSNSPLNVPVLMVTLDFALTVLLQVRRLVNAPHTSIPVDRWVVMGCVTATNEEINLSLAVMSL